MRWGKILLPTPDHYFPTLKHPQRDIDTPDIRILADSNETLTLGHTMLMMKIITAATGLVKIPFLLRKRINYCP